MVETDKADSRSARMAGQREDGFYGDGEQPWWEGSVWAAADGSLAPGKSG